MPLTADNLSRATLFSLGGKTPVLISASGFLGRTLDCALLANSVQIVALDRRDRLRAETSTAAGSPSSSVEAPR